MREKRPHEKTRDEVDRQSEKNLLLPDVEPERNVAAGIQFKTTQIARADTKAGEWHVRSRELIKYCPKIFPQRTRWNGTPNGNFFFIFNN